MQHSTQEMEISEFTGTDGAQPVIWRRVSEQRYPQGNVPARVVAIFPHVPQSYIDAYNDDVAERTGVRFANDLVFTFGADEGFDYKDYEYVVAHSLRVDDDEAEVLELKAALASYGAITKTVHRRRLAQ